MSLLALLDQLRGTQRLDDAVAQIARRAYAPLREGCELLVPQMTRAEARGYIWAKARPIIALDPAAIAGQAKLPATVQAMLTEQARDQATQEVLGDLMRQRLDRAARKRAA